MKVFSSLSVTFKIVFAVSMLAGMLVVLSVIVIMALRSIQQEVGRLTMLTVPRLTTIGALREEVALMKITALRHILAQDDAGRERMEAELNRQRESVRELLQRKQDLMFSETGRRLYDAVYDSHVAYEHLQQEIIGLSREGRSDEARRMNAARLRPQYDMYQHRLEELEHYIVEDARQREASVSQSVFAIKNFCFLFTLAGAFISGWMAVFVTGIIKTLRRRNGLLQTEIADRQKAEAANEKLIAELQQVLEKVKQLKGLLPICCSCKKIRDDRGYWESIEKYISQHTDAEFSHGICPACAKKLYPSVYKQLASGGNS